MRNTVQRSVILKAVMQAGYHPTADDIYREVVERCPAISRATVYRDLARLADSGEILRVGVPNAPDRYDRTTGSHGHFICSECGQVWDLPLPETELPEGFVARSENLIISGFCGECENRRKSREDPEAMDKVKKSAQKEINKGE